jgi:hypothetical protein
MVECAKRSWSALADDFRTFLLNPDIFELNPFSGLRLNYAEWLHSGRRFPNPGQVLTSGLHPPRASSFASQNRFELSGSRCACLRFSGAKWGAVPRRHPPVK